MSRRGWMEEGEGTVGGEENIDGGRIRDIWREERGWV